MTVVAPSRPRHRRPATAPVAGPRTRPAWRAVALPSEHGGWGLTLEPVVLGLALAPSIAGAALGLAGLLAFLLRTPLKLVLVDHRRGRSLPRTAMARRVASAEGAAVLVLAAVALVSAGPAWLVPVALAAPLVAVELWFDVRSRGRRLVPELCGAAGMAALAASVAVAGGAPVTVAGVAWALLAARSIAAIPYVRTQVLRLHRTGTAAPGVGGALLAQGAGVGLAVAAVAVEPAAHAGAVSVTVAGLVRLVGLRWPPRSAVRLGAIESVIGVVVVVATAVGLHLGGAV
jgi:hypothetical protein